MIPAPQALTTAQVEDGAASAIEAGRIHTLIREFTPLSNDLRRVDIRYGEADDGTPGMWITLVLAGDDNPSKERVREINEAKDFLRHAILAEDTGRWPFISVGTE
jgi:hypothetical protein